MKTQSTHGIFPKHLLRAGSLALFCALAFPLVAAAETAVPKPGESLEGSKPPKQSVPLENVDKGTGQQGAESVRFTLTEIRVEHDGIKVKDEKIDAITRKIIGKEIDAEELNGAIGNVTRYIRAHGYPAAAAYIPEQTAVGGKLLVKVEPGRLGSIHLSNESKLKDSAAQRILAGLKAGEIIRTRGLENALYNLRDLSGVQVLGVLSPGAETGTSDLTVRLLNDKKTSVILYSENYGSESAGRYRYGVQGEIRNLSGMGDRLNLGALFSNNHQHNYNISYETTVGRSASKLGIGFSRADYELGNEFKATFPGRSTAMYFMRDWTGCSADRRPACSITRRSIRELWYPIRTWPKR